MNEYPAFSVRVPRGFDFRFASIYSPAPSPQPGGPAKYQCGFPASSLPAGVEDWLGNWVRDSWRPTVKEQPDGTRYVVAQSNLPPLIVPGIGSRSCVDWWAHQLKHCELFNLPKDFLFRHLDLDLLVQPVEWNRPPYGQGILLNLKAVVVRNPGDDRDLTKLLADTRAAIKDA